MIKKPKNSNISNSNITASNITGSLLARNTLLNFIGQILPLLVGIVTMPFVIRSLGTERFGLLSLAWVVLGYFAIFDMGLGRATTKFVAEALGKGEEKEIPSLVWTSVTIQAMMGIAGGLVLAGVTPLLVERILNIPLELMDEARSTFYLLALSVPIVLISGSFRGVLEASQRFDLVNAVKIPNSSLTYLLPLVGVFLGFQLPGIVALILLARLGALVILVMLNLRLRPALKRYSNSFKLFPRLFSFGGWVMVSSIVSPILQYFDRLLIGSILTMSAITYYTVPLDVVSRLWVIPGSLVMTLFPAFSTLGITHKEELWDFYIRASKYIAITMIPIALFFMVFANEILEIWLGADFAQNSTIPLQILSLGVLIGSMTQPSFALFQGIGRPDIGAKIHLLMLPVSFVLAWVLISKMGISGAAISWTISRGFGLLLSLKMVQQVFKINLIGIFINKVLCRFIWFLVFGGLLVSLLLVENSIIKVCIALFTCLLFVIIVWHHVMDNKDRGVVLRMLMKLFGSQRLKKAANAVKSRSRGEGI